MRERKNFAERTRISKEDKTRKKYFLVCEGNRTEGIYFNTINELKDKIGINPLIEIISIERTYTEEGWSNPKKILEQLLKDLEEIENGKISYKTLVDKIIELDKIYEYPAKKIFILIEPEDSYRYSRLKDLINFNKGKTQIVFAIKNKDEKKLQTMNKGIKLSKEFFENLVELMGIDKIKIVM